MKKSSKKTFRNLIKKLCSLGIAKEIYRSDSFSVLNFNDLFYLLYFLEDYLCLRKALIKMQS